MKNFRTDLLGWIVAAALLGVFAGGGFQGNPSKAGVVDMVKVAEDSTAGKANSVTFLAQKTVREELIKFMDQNRVIAPDQAKRLRELSLKEKRTDVESAELERLKADIKASGAKLVELQSKTSITPEERLIMEDYARRAQGTDAVIQQWFQEFGREMQGVYDAQRLALLDSVRAAAKIAGKNAACTVVFDANAAPYGANDLTAATLDIMNKK